MKIASSSLTLLRYAVTKSICRMLQPLTVANASRIFYDVNRAVEAKVSLKLTPFHCIYPRITIRALRSFRLLSDATLLRSTYFPVTSRPQRVSPPSRHRARAPTSSTSHRLGNTFLR